SQARAHFVAQAFGPQIERKQTSLFGEVHRNGCWAIAELEVAIENFDGFFDAPSDDKRPPRMAYAARNTSGGPKSGRLLARDIEVAQRPIRLATFYVEVWLMMANQLELAKLSGEFVTHHFPNEAIGILGDAAFL